MEQRSNILAQSPGTDAIYIESRALAGWSGVCDRTLSRAACHIIALSSIEPEHLSTCLSDDRLQISGI